MFKFSSRRQREYLAKADDSSRRSKVRSYLKKINSTDLSARPLHQYDEAFDPAQWGPHGLRRSEHIDFRFKPALPSSGRSSYDSVPRHTTPPSPGPKRTILHTSSFPSTWKGKTREVVPNEDKEDMIEMVIHHQNQNKIVILFDAIFWKTSPSRSYQPVPTADIALALELFQENDKTRSSHWWMLAQAASKETAMRYSFTETGIRIDYIRNSKNVRFSSEESPIHIYEPIWIDDSEEDGLEWEHRNEALYYEEDEDTDDSEVLKLPVKVDEAAFPTRDKLKLLSRLFPPNNSKIKIIPTSPSESSISSGSVDHPL